MTGERNTSTAADISTLLGLEDWSDEEREAHFARQEAALAEARAQAKSRLPELSEDDEGQEVLNAYSLAWGGYKKTRAIDIWQLSYWDDFWKTCALPTPAF